MRVQVEVGKSQPVFAFTTENIMQNRSSNIGGQAVMEGIMMRHKDKYSIAVRRPDGGIELKVEDYKCTFGKAAFLRKPIIRGVVSFVDSLVVGTKCLMYSAEIAGDEEDEQENKKNAHLTAEEKRTGSLSGFSMEQWQFPLWCLFLLLCCFPMLWPVF